MGSSQDSKNQEPERPKIYVTEKGARYVDVNELMRSKRGRAAVKAAAKIPVTRPFPYSSKGNLSKVQPCLK